MKRPDDGTIHGSELWPDHAPLAIESHHGIPCPVYRDRPRDVGEFLRRAVTSRPERDALIEVSASETRRLPYREFDRLVAAVAAGLKALGVQPGDRVGLLLVNGIPFCLSIFAIWRLGAIAVPLNTKCKTVELEHALRDSGVTVLIMNPNWWDSIEPVRADLPPQHIVVTEPAETGKTVSLTPIAGTIPFATLLATDRFEPEQQVPVSAHATAVIMYTSGTTGAPKGAMLSHWNLVHAVMSYQDTLGLGPDERTVVAVPLFHVTGLIAQFLVMVSVAGTTAMLPTFQASQLLRALAEEQITIFHAAPTVYIMLLREPGIGQIALPHWRVAAAGGAALPSDTIDALRTWLPHLRVQSVFGMTETSSPCTVMPAGAQPRFPASSGLPVPVMAARIVDEEGMTLGPGATGELWVSGATVAEGYWGNGAATAATFGGGWLRTGDLARIDSGGYVMILDRKKDMINRGAEKVYCVEVENVLHCHPAVVEAALVGVPDSVYGERVKAVVVPVAGAALSGEQIREFVRARLAHFKAPDIVEFRSALPRNPNGKVVKSLLR